MKGVKKMAVKGEKIQVNYVCLQPKVLRLQSNNRAEADGQGKKKDAAHTIDACSLMFLSRYSWDMDPV